MEFQIRTATYDDLSFILGVINHHIVHTTAIYDYQEKSLEDMEKWWREKEAHQFPVFIAHVNGVPAGFATYGQFRLKEGYKHTVEHSIYLDPAFQGKGIGSLLMETLIDHATEANIHVMIGGIDAENVTSIRFHERFGFEISGHLKEVGYKFDRWLDVVFMQKTLV